MSAFGVKRTSFWGKSGHQGMSANDPKRACTLRIKVYSLMQVHGSGQFYCSPRGRSRVRCPGDAGQRCQCRVRVGMPEHSQRLVLNRSTDNIFGFTEDICTPRLSYPFGNFDSPTHKFADERFYLQRQQTFSCAFGIDCQNVPKKARRIYQRPLTRHRHLPFAGSARALWLSSCWAGRGRALAGHLRGAAR